MLTAGWNHQKRHCFPKQLLGYCNDELFSFHIHLRENINAVVVKTLKSASIFHCFTNILLFAPIAWNSVSKCIILQIPWKHQKSPWAVVVIGNRIDYNNFYNLLQSLLKEEQKI